jgi:uncharacterized protein (DUF2062 family)
MASWAAGPSACSDPLIAHRKIMKLQYTKQSLSTLIAAGLFSLTIPSALAEELAGAVQGASQPIAGSTVTIYDAGTGEPAQLAQRSKP